jgi:hypothetical protein
MSGRGSLVTGVALAVMLGTGLTAAAPGSGLPRASAQTKAQAAQEGLADQFFRLEWTASAGQHGQARIRGYVYNEYQRDADELQLRITELDASGNPIGSVLRHVDQPVPALDRAYFDVQVPGQAASYRVAVEAFTFQEGER